MKTLSFFSLSLPSIFFLVAGVTTSGSFTGSEIVIEEENTVNLVVSFILVFLCSFVSYFAFWICKSQFLSVTTIFELKAVPHVPRREIRRRQMNSDDEIPIDVETHCREVVRIIFGGWWVAGSGWQVAGSRF